MGTTASGLFGAKGSGFYGNQNPPQYKTGVYYMPPGYWPNDSVALTTTATRVYYFPLPIFYAHTFQGASTYNGGAGDNGENIRLMVFNDADGSIGTLAKDFGQITLTAAAAQRDLTSSWAATPGMYWGAVWTETAMSMQAMSPFMYNGANFVAFNLVNNSAMGTFSPAIDNRAMLTENHYVDTAYGSAPATAVAPTATTTADIGGTSAGTPIFWLKA